MCVIVFVHRICTKKVGLRYEYVCQGLFHHNNARRPWWWLSTLSSLQELSFKKQHTCAWMKADLTHSVSQIIQKPVSNQSTEYQKGVIFYACRSRSISFSVTCLCCTLNYLSMYECRRTWLVLIGCLRCWRIFTGIDWWKRGRGQSCSF